MEYYPTLFVEPLKGSIAVKAYQLSYIDTVNNSLLRALCHIALLLVLGLSPIMANATHIVGGELFYTYLGDNLYNVTLFVYRDCGPTNTNGTDFDDFASVGVFSNGFLVNELSMSLFSGTVTNVPVELENPCFILPPDVCVEKAEYNEIIYLEPSEFGYDLVYQRCCRNPSIVNLFLPEDQGITMWSHIPADDVLVEENNSSAYFNNFPPVALCTNADFWFDHSATDPDGDSLVYELCHPYHGASPDFPAPAPPLPPPFINITYDTGFDEDYPITSNPAFEIDPETGWLTGTPTAVGQYVIGICVSEYRDGEFLCRNSRDFQFNVTLCDPNIIASIPEQEDLCDGLEVTFENNSVNASSFFWDFNDPLNPGATSTLANPTYSFMEAGNYGVMLIANPSWPCADTAIVEFTVWPEMNPEILEPEWICEDDQVYVDFTLDGTFQPGTSFDWTMPFGSSPAESSVQNPQNVTFETTGEQFVNVQTEYQGCIEEAAYTFVIPEAPTAEIIAQETYCDGFTYTFGNASQNGMTYNWDFGEPFLGLDVSEEFEPEYTYTDTGLFVVELMVGADFHCPVTDTEEFLIYTLLDPFFLTPEPQCFDNHSFDFEALGTTNPEAVYSWDFGATATPGGSSNPTVDNVTFDSPGYHPVTITIFQDVCEKFYTDSILLVPNPEAEFSILADAGCPPFSVTFINESDVQTLATWEWNFGDGTTAITENPVHVYQNSGTYTVSVTVTTTAGCFDTDTFVLEDLITVYPEPNAGIDVEPNVVNILDPTVEIFDLSSGGVACEYLMSDGGSLEDCNGFYTFSDGGYFDVVQYVINEFGCVDTARAEVAVEGTTFYAPNAFTPDGDGINDVWLPVALGVNTYRLTIYNRWGEAIFETNDRHQPWVGNVKNGDYYAQDGLYLWRVWYTDLLGLSHEHQGHVTILR